MLNYLFRFFNNFFIYFYSVSNYIFITVFFLIILQILIWPQIYKYNKSAVVCATEKKNSVRP